MAGQDIVGFDLFQKHYDPLIVKLLSAEAKAFKKAKVQKWEGDEHKFAVHLRRNPNLGFTEDGGAFPTAGSQTAAQTSIGRRFLVHKLQLSTGLMHAAKTRANAFAAAEAFEVEGAMDDLLAFMNAMFYLNGDGKIGVLKGSPASATANIQVDNSALLWPGKVLEVRDTSASDALLNNIKVLAVEQAIDSDGYTQFSIDTGYGTGIVSASAAAGDTLVWEDSYDRAINGLDALIDDAATTFQGISTSTYPEYTSYVNSNSGTLRALSPLILRKTIAALAQAGGASNVGTKTLLTNAFGAMNFSELYDGAVRIDPGTAQVGSMVSTFVTPVGALKVEVDTQCPRNKMFIVDEAELVHAVQKPLGFDRDATSTFRASHTNLTNTAILSGISQMAIKNRRKCAKIEDVTDAASVSWA